MKKVFSSLLSWQCFAALLAVCMITVPFVLNNQLVDKGPSWRGLDISWKMTLNYAFIKHWTWGKDIVYTYGPLAAFSTRIGWGISRWVFLVFDGFIIVNFYFVFIDFLKNNKNKFAAVAMIICTMLVVNQFFGSDLSWVLLFLIIYWIIKTFYDQRPIFLAILLLLTVLAFYIKMNTGLIAMLLLSAHFVNQLVCKKITPVKLLVCCVSFILLIAISAALLHVSIFNYITGSLEIIKGYNYVMYLDEIHPHIEHNLYILFFAILLWFLYTLWGQVREKKYNLVLIHCCRRYVYFLTAETIGIKKRCTTPV